MRAGIGNETTGKAINARSTAARYDALIRVSEALRGYHDREALFGNLARELLPVVWFSFLGITLYDEQTHTIQKFALEGTNEPLASPHEDADDSAAYWMVQHQEPLVFPFEDGDTRFARSIAYLESLGIQSACALPLTSPRRRLGMLFHGSRERYSYDAEDLAFLSLVANQVALAIENAENYEALQHSLALERDRMRNVEACDELLRALSTVLDIRRVFPQVSQIAATVLPHDLLTFAFLNGREVFVQATSHEWAPLPTRLKVEHLIPDGGGSVIIGDFEERDVCPPVVPRDFWDRVRSAGYRSSLAVHVPARDQMLSLAFWSKRPQAFDERQLGMARRIADHVALAVSHEQLADLARQAAENKLRADRLEARVRSLSEELASKAGRMVGRSDAWQAVLKAATQVASTDTTVLLAGESGTGKEVVARFIHHASNRANGPFVALNCAALPEQLLESELFGYERGAFTGAQQAKPGQIELAAGGVLFLDEVAEMSASAQAKFLRVLQEREFQRLGSTRMLKANVRVIAATNRDLQKALERGDFREDLFYRLQVFDIKLPSLRARPTDILPLSEAFLEQIGQTFGRPPSGLTRDAKEALMHYDWPGNVRELRNALERAAILCEGGLITAEHLSLDRARRGPLPPAGASTTDLSAVERDMIAQVLADCSGNKSMAAAKLGISRTQLYVRLRRYRIS
jgi:formate hydrogenlyase transcriptional activator